MKNGGLARNSHDAKPETERNSKSEKSEYIQIPKLNDMYSTIHSIASSNNEEQKAKSKQTVDSPYLAIPLANAKIEEGTSGLNKDRKVYVEMPGNDQGDNPYEPLFRSQEIYDIISSGQTKGNYDSISGGSNESNYSSIPTKVDDSTDSSQDIDPLYSIRLDQQSHLQNQLV
eukprot:TRINITY_DN10003_c0_g1_i1.p1 TRINITY_DN10003_c0_g1~~TRINITY_DN10003_c0_g1_i1.p1  ORF type:complete len:185 (+),score=25.33 TRINITY_DN10003_c0_g1_i1:42-557(+)